MEDFTFGLVFGAVTFTVTLNESNDLTPWVGDIVRSTDGALVDWDALVTVVAEHHAPMLHHREVDEERAEVWLHEALQRRLDFQRETLGGKSHG